MEAYRLINGFTFLLKLPVRIISNFIYQLIKSLKLDFTLLMQFNFIKRLAKVIDPLLLLGRIFFWLWWSDSLGLDGKRQGFDQLHQWSELVVGNGENNLTHDAR